MFKATQNFLILIATLALLFSACATQQQSAEQMKQEQEFVARLEKLAVECKNNNATSCFDLGGILLNASRADDKEKIFDDEMLMTTQDVFFQSCELNHGDGCFFYAMLSAISGLDTLDFKSIKHSRELIGNDEFAMLLKYIKKSCELDSANGCETLGKLYYLGDGVKKDEKLGFFYRKKGCDLAQTYNDRDKGLADMAGNYGCARVGLMYYNGESVAQNKKLALEYFYKSCAFSGYHCGIHIQNFYEGYSGESIRVPQDYEFAFKLAKKGCEANNNKSCNYLGNLYQDGKGTAQDSKKAFLTFYDLCHNKPDSLIPTERGSYAYIPDASDFKKIGCYNLALSYANGQGVKQNYKRAFGMFKELCDKDEMASACGIVGEYYYNAKGVRQDCREALEYFSMACDMGEQSGCDNHKMMKQNPYGHGLSDSDFE